jgi:hypothetical protein
MSSTWVTVAATLDLSRTRAAQRLSRWMVGKLVVRLGEPG